MSPSIRELLVVGNWKMNGSRASVRTLLNAIVNKGRLGCDVLVCPSYVLLDVAFEALQGSDVGLSAQNVDWNKEGAYTGEVSVSMLKEAGCSHTLVGHSERRELLGETDEVVAKKFVAAIDNGLWPILCVGESLPEREAGSTESVVLRQLNAVLNLIGIERLGESIIAYEPVWAIGTGKSATAFEANAVHELIRSRLAKESEQISESVRILYGGSVKPENADELFEMKDIDGALVGGASLDAGSFLAICEAAERQSRSDRVS
jgi:triosephosphate isomerase